MQPSFEKGDFIVSLLLATHTERVSVSRMLDLCEAFHWPKTRLALVHWRSCSTIEWLRVELFNKIIADNEAKLSALELGQNL